MQRKGFLRDANGVIKTPYRVAVVGIVLALVYAGGRILYYRESFGSLPIFCMFYECTGYYCPGCGSGRACYALLHGEIYQAFRYNPLLFVMGPWLAGYFVVLGVQWLRKGKETVSRRIPTKVACIVLILVCLYGVLRNLHCYPFSLLAPTTVS